MKVSFLKCSNFFPANTFGNTIPKTPFDFPGDKSVIELVLTPISSATYDCIWLNELKNS